MREGSTTTPRATTERTRTVDLDPIDADSARSFLESGRLAVVGASGGSKNFGRTIYRELKNKGVEVVAVHPGGGTIDGDQCAPSLSAVDGHVDGAIVMVPSSHAAQVVRDCIDKGIRKVWLFRGLGGEGSVSEEALELCRENGIEVVPGACPLMFLEPVGWFHRLHRSARRRRGAIAVTAG